MRRHWLQLNTQGSRDVLDAVGRVRTPKVYVERGDPPMASRRGTNRQPRHTDEIPATRRASAASSCRACDTRPARRRRALDAEAARFEGRGDERFQVPASERRVGIFDAITPLLRIRSAPATLPGSGQHGLVAGRADRAATTVGKPDTRVAGRGDEVDLAR
jgi:hypothetical protein